MRFLEPLGEPARVVCWVVGFLIIGLLGVLDHKAGLEFRFAFFYLVPILLIAWFTGLRAGVVASLISVLVWVIANLVKGEGFDAPTVAWGNAVTILAFFLGISLLFSRLRDALRHEKELARLDYLTGALNVRAFREVTQAEIDRSRRYQHPFTIAYFDVDDFKAVNDRCGHDTGDELLRVIVATIKESIRTTDIVARLGGDEFAILFPESRPDTIVETIQRIQETLLTERPNTVGPVTFSIGALTCMGSAVTFEEIMSRVDQLMYAVKSEGKNRLRHEILNLSGGIDHGEPPISTTSQLNSSTYKIFRRQLS